MSIRKGPHLRLMGFLLRTMRTSIANRHGGDRSMKSLTCAGKAVVRRSVRAI